MQHDMSARQHSRGALQQCECCVCTLQAGQDGVSLHHECMQLAAVLRNHYRAAHD